MSSPVSYLPLVIPIISVYFEHFREYLCFVSFQFFIADDGNIPKRS